MPHDLRYDTGWRFHPFGKCAKRATKAVKTDMRQAQTNRCGHVTCCVSLTYPACRGPRCGLLEMCTRHRQARALAVAALS